MPDFFVDSLDDPLLDAGAKAFTAVNSAVNTLFPYTTPSDDRKSVV